MVATTTLAELARKLGLEAPSAYEGVRLCGVAPLDVAGPDYLSFLDNPAYRQAAASTRAAAVLVRAADEVLLPPQVVPLVVANPYVAMARALALFHPSQPVVAGVSPHAHVAAGARVDATAQVEAGAVLASGVVVGAGAVVGACTVLGEGVVVGEGTRIGSHCTLLKTKIGARCIIHSGARIGQDGFGFAMDGAVPVKVPQVGGVVIGDDVEIGANSTIDCGALGDTIIGDMVKLDNQVQVGHNVCIGRGCRIAAQTGIAGSTVLGDSMLVGGQVGIAGHLTLANRVVVAARSGVTKSISTVGAVVAGIPAEPIMEWRRKVATLARLTRRKKAEASADSAPEEQAD